MLQRSRYLVFILLTSLTMFVGCLPMVFATSPQARYFIHTAIAPGFGIMFSAAVILLLPACRVIIQKLSIHASTDLKD